MHQRRYVHTIVPGLVALLAAFAACDDHPLGLTDSQPIVDLAALTTHPGGVGLATQPLGERPFGVAVSRHGVVYITRLDAESMAGAKLPHTTFSRGVTVGAIPTDVAFTHDGKTARSEEHTSELQSRLHLVCRLLLEKKKKNMSNIRTDDK